MTENWYVAEDQFRFWNVENDQVFETSFRWEKKPSLLLHQDVINSSVIKYTLSESIAAALRLIPMLKIFKNKAVY